MREDGAVPKELMAEAARELAALRWIDEMRTGDSGVATTTFSSSDEMTITSSTFGVADTD